MKKRLIAFSVVVVLVCSSISIMPALAAPVNLYRDTCYTAEEGNIARLPSVRQLTNASEARYNPLTGAGIDRPGINANFCNDSYGTPNTQVLRVTDGNRPSSGSSNGYLAWSYVDTFGVNNRLYFVLNWGQPFIIDAIRCDWWTDSNVSVPNSEAKVEWLDGAEWKEVTNMRNPATGAAVTTIGTLGMGNWNAVTFDQVKTSQLRLKLHRTGTVSNGIGLGEWEVFGVATDPELRSVSVSGAASPVVSSTSTYTATASDYGLTGVTYEWSVSGNVSIVGSNTGATVQVKADDVGAGTVTCKATLGDKTVTSPAFAVDVQNISVAITGDLVVPTGSQMTYTATPTAGTLTAAYEWSLNNENAKIVGASTNSTVTLEGMTSGAAKLTCKITAGKFSASDVYDLDVRELKALDYIGATAAGRAPILPRRVVVDGVRFDLPTTSVKSTTKPAFDFAEEFEDSLIPVVWNMNSFTAADYATAGKTFTVTGVTAAGSRAPGIAAKAVFTVNAPLAAPDYNHSVTSENVIFENGFWAQKQLVNATTTLDAAATQLAGSASYAERNFVNALGRLQKVWNGDTNPPMGTYAGYVFQDTDVYKTLEGYAYNLAAIWDDTSVSAARKAQLLDKAKYWISLIEQIQYADGYLNSCFSNRSTTGSGGSGQGLWRWRYMQRHEMYNIGHFLEAAVAYTRFAVSTGQDDPYVLYEVGRRAADHIVEFFGPGGKRMEVPGHEEIELALMKFATLCEEYEGQDTGRKYRDTVETLVDRRGRKTDEYLRESGYFTPNSNGATYSQDMTPLVNETKAVGHAVRAMYFYTGATDSAISMPDSNPNKAAFLKGITNIYDSVSERNTYITGGLGSGESSEGFGPDWHIRSNDGYTENCAAIAGANWYQRLNLYYEDAKYADSYERALYNGVLVGVTLQGDRFAYSTRIDQSTARSAWQGCACCPPNVLRTIANMGGYMYTVNKDKVFVNMYGESKGHVNVQGDDVRIDQVTNYPWDGNIKLTVAPPADKTFTLNLRLPGWVKAQKYQQVTLLLDDEEIDATANDKGYIAITRKWPAAGTVIQYNIPMEVRVTEGDVNVSRVYSSATDRYAAAQGQWDKVAVERGPIVYTLESASVPNGDPATATTGRTAANIRLPRDLDSFQLVNRLSGDDMILRGVYTIEGFARYNTTTGPRDQWVQLIPYYAKTNRGGNPSNTANTSSTTASDIAKLWISATENRVLIRGDLYRLTFGATATLQANPKVNASDYFTWASGTGDNTVYSPTGASLQYEWKILDGSDVIRLSSAAASKTDDKGPGKIGGVNYQFDASVAQYEAIGYGTATVQVTMKSGTGEVLATDTYEIKVSDLSIDDRLVILADDIPPDSSETFSPRFSMLAREPMEVNLIVASYDERGALLDINSQHVILRANEKALVRSTIPRNPSAKTYRFFVWDTNSLRPLTGITSTNEL